MGAIVAGCVALPLSCPRLSSLLISYLERQRQPDASPRLKAGAYDTRSRQIASCKRRPGALKRKKQKQTTTKTFRNVAFNPCLARVPILSHLTWHTCFKNMHTPKRRQRVDCHRASSGAKLCTCLRTHIKRFPPCRKFYSTTSTSSSELSSA